MFIIVGLGNPSKKYAKTRHNAGWIIIDALQKLWQKEFGFNEWQESKKFSSLISQGNIQKQKILLAKPLTFMNESGRAVQALVRFYKEAPEHLLVIHDDVDIAFERFKLQKNRSSAGHKGVESIIQALGTQNFWRLRIGIAKVTPKQQEETSKFVLKKFSLLEQWQIKKIVPDVVKLLFEKLDLSA